MMRAALTAFSGSLPRGSKTANNVVAAVIGCAESPNSWGDLHAFGKLKAYTARYRIRVPTWLMKKYLVPHIPREDLPAMLRIALVGGVVAGAYGILHDQITYSISPEYFTKLKFKQFHYANVGLGNRVFVATIAFLATSCVGFVAAWFLARRMIPKQSRSVAYRQIAAGFGIIFGCGILFGLIGFAYGLWRGSNAEYWAWVWAFQRYDITDTWAFVRVAYIHNASYLGGAVGLILALVLIRTNR